MKVEYKGHKILRGLDGVDMRHLRPAAIITGKHEEKQLIDKVIAKSGYVGCVFDDDDGVHGIVTLDGKEDEGEQIEQEKHTEDDGPIEMEHRHGE